MDRVAGTNVCHASFRYRNDVRTSYSFGPDLPLVSWRTADQASWDEFRAFIRAARLRFSVTNGNEACAFPRRSLTSSNYTQTLGEG